MSKKWVQMGVEVLIIIIIFASGFVTAVLYLWNWLMPQLFGLHAITYWQALGLLGLCWILFGGFGWLGGGSRRYGQPGGRMTERFERMTPEERSRFREGISGQC
jgi:hypothetical protein